MILKKYSINSLYSLFLTIIVLRCFFPFFFSPFHWIENDPLRHWSSGVNFLEFELNSGIDAIMYQIYIFLLHRISGGDEILINFIKSGRKGKYYEQRELGKHM